LVRKVDVNILNKQWRTFDMGSPTPWRMGEALKSRSRNSLLRYEIFHRTSDLE